MLPGFGDSPKTVRVGATGAPVRSCVFQLPEKIGRQIGRRNSEMHFDLCSGKPETDDVVDVEHDPASGKTGDRSCFDERVLCPRFGGSRRLKPALRKQRPSLTRAAARYSQASRCKKNR